MALTTKDHTAGGTKAVVEFTAATVSVLESEKKVRIGIRRYGKMDTPATIRLLYTKVTFLLLFRLSVYNLGITIDLFAP